MGKSGSFLIQYQNYVSGPWYVYNQVLLFGSKIGGCFFCVEFVWKSCQVREFMRSNSRIREKFGIDPNGANTFRLCSNRFGSLRP